MIKTIEERVDDIERGLGEIMGCLGLEIFKNPDGRVGYNLKASGPEAGWGILVKMFAELRRLKSEKKIIIPGR